jgi:hypothetical protein
MLRPAWPSSAARVSSLPCVRDTSATEKPLLPTVFAMDWPRPEPAPTMAMVGTVVPFEM